MKIYKKKDIKKIAIHIKNGDIIIFPTETSYGMGCDATNQVAVDKIFKIKNRSIDKPLLILVSSTDIARKYVEWNDSLNILAEKFWPGALTIIGKYIGSDLTAGVVSKNNTLAVRVTADKWLLKLMKNLDTPLVATSANLSGDNDIYDSQEIINQYSKQKLTPNLIVDAGVLPKNNPTTVVNVLENYIKVLRQGDVRV